MAGLQLKVVGRGYAPDANPIRVKEKHYLAVTFTISCSTDGKIFRHDHIDALPIGMNAVSLVQFRVGGHSIQKKRIENGVIFSGRPLQKRGSKAAM